MDFVVFLFLAGALHMHTQKNPFVDRNILKEIGPNKKNIMRKQ